jgi:hypothetical protein
MIRVMTNYSFLRAGISQLEYGPQEEKYGFLANFCHKEMLFGKTEH